MPATPELWKDLGIIETVNTDNTFQYDPKVTQLTNGNILVAWTSTADTGAGSLNGFDIIGKIYDSLGNLVQDETSLNNFATHDEDDFDIAALPGGGFVVVYVDDEGSDITPIRMTEWNADATLGNSTTIAADTADSDTYRNPSVAVSSDTSVLVTWEHVNPNSNADVTDVNVEGAIYDAVTNSVGVAFTLFNGAEGTDEGISGTAAAVLSNGNYAVARGNNNPGNDAIQVSILGTDGVQVGSTIIVSGSNTYEQDPHIVGLTGGGFVVVFEVSSADPPTNSGLRAIVYDNAGTAVSGFLTPPTTFPGNQSNGAVAALADGGFVIAWLDEGTRDIHGQRFDAVGSKVGVEFDIDTDVGNLSLFKDLDVQGLDDGRFVVTWDEENQIFPGGFPVFSADTRAAIFDPRDDENTPAVYTDNQVIGTIGNDSITVAAADENVFGWNGNDTFFVGAPSAVQAGDVLDGGIDFDTVGFGGTGTQVYDFQDVTLTSIERLSLDNGGGSKTVILRADQVGTGLLATDAAIRGTGATVDDNNLQFIMGSDLSLDLSGFTFVLWNEFDSIEIIGDGDSEAITGTSQNDSIDGGAGNDTLAGGAGDDTLTGGVGFDGLLGGANDDTFIYLAGHDIDFIDGGADTDTFDASGATENMRIDLEDGTHEYDNNGNEETFANVENVETGSGNDRIVGFADNTFLDFTFNGNGGNDTIEGGNNNETIFGGDGDDMLSGGGQADVINGGDNNDTLEGGGALDTLNGGDGDDTFLVTNNNADVIDGGTGLNTLDATGLTSIGLTVTSIEGNYATFGPSGTLTNISAVLGSEQADQISASGSTFDVTLMGNGGNDTLDGGEGADRLLGRNGADSLSGDTGTDTLLGGDGDDSLFGGDDNDTLAGGHDNDSIRGENNDDLIFGNNGNDKLLGGSGADTISGGNDNDTVAGGNDNDSVEGGNGDDLLFGNSGDDTLSGEDGADEISGGNGADLVFGRSGEDTLRGANDDDRIFAGSQDDLVAGNTGNDTLEGGSGDDRLFGGADNDILNGGSGTDFMSGGNGQDIFVFESVSDSAHGGSRDTISGFTHGADRIDLSDIMSGLSFIGGAGYSGTAGEVRYNDNIGRLYIDVDGDSASDFSVDITGAPVLDAGDLIL